MARIIIAEDEVMIRLSLKNILMDQDHDIIAMAKNSQEVIDFSTKLKPDIVFMDISLETKNAGIYACEQIKMSNNNVKIIFISGYPREIYKNELYNINFDDYLEKPVLEKDVLQSIKQL